MSHLQDAGSNIHHITEDLPISGAHPDRQKKWLAEIKQKNRIPSFNPADTATLHRMIGRKQEHGADNSQSPSTGMGHHGNEANTLQDHLQDRVKLPIHPPRSQT
jgi:hypothetical protein